MKKIKPIERLLADSLPIFHITRASVINIEQTDLPFGFDYTFMSSTETYKSGRLDELLAAGARIAGEAWVVSPEEYARRMLELVEQ